MFKLIKENWHIAVISGATGSSITLLMLFIFHVKSWDSTLMTNWISALGSIVSGVGAVGAIILAYFAYKYATKQHLNNEIAKLEFSCQYDVINTLINEVSFFVISYMNIIAQTHMLLECINSNDKEIKNIQGVITSDLIKTEQKLEADKRKKAIEIYHIKLQVEKLKLLNTKKINIEKIFVHLQQYATLVKNISGGQNYGVIQQINFITNDMDLCNALRNNLAKYEICRNLAQRIVDDVIEESRLILNQYNQFNKPQRHDKINCII